MSGVPEAHRVVRLHHPVPVLGAVDPDSNPEPHVLRALDDFTVRAPDQVASHQRLERELVSAQQAAVAQVVYQRVEALAVSDDGHGELERRVRVPHVCERGGRGFVQRAQ